MIQRFNFVVKLMKPAPAFVVCAISLILANCTHAPKTTISTCENTDWWEVGRTDGAAGAPPVKLGEYAHRCNSTPSPVSVDLYMNGRDAGLVDFCTPLQGLETGRLGIPYQNVCPAHLEDSFLISYTIGSRIHVLETEDVDLDARIENMVQLLGPEQTGMALRSQIDQLRTRRAQIDGEIRGLERNAEAAAKNASLPNSAARALEESSERSSEKL